MSAKESTSRAPESHTDDPVVGRYFAAENFERMRMEVYFCEGRDDQLEYCMANVNDPSDHRTVGPRALGRTWNDVEDHGKCWWVPAAHLCLNKVTLARPVRPGEGYLADDAP